jgi:hypothetical protein
MEGTGFMRLERICRFMLVPVALLCCETAPARAQGEPQAPKLPAPIPLELSAESVDASAPGAPLSATPVAPVVAPAPVPNQLAPNYGGGGPNALLRQLRNPFDGSASPDPVQRPATIARTPEPPVYPTHQGTSSQSYGGKAGLKRLCNPFDGDHGQRKPRHFEHPSPQYEPSSLGTEAVPEAPAAPTRMPGVTLPPPAPGAEMMPGVSAPGPSEGVTPEAAAAPSAAETFSAAAAAAGPGFGTALEAGAVPFAMIGDLSPLVVGGRVAATGSSGTPPVPPPVPPPGPPRPPGVRGASPVYASVRTFKASENQSPRPQDRIYFDFNYYNNANDAINRRDLSPITQMKVYTYLFGVEKTFNGGLGSIGIRVPIDNLTANSYQNVISTPTSTAMGNLTVFAKYILAQNPQTGSLISAGFAVSPPTGPGQFAGARYLFGINSIYFQPFIGYIYNYNRWYVQGFTGFNFAANPNDVSLIYNDVGIGYFLFRSPDPDAFLSALAPTVELHVTNPLNHRDVFNRFDIAGSPDAVDLTYGLNFLFRRAAVLTAAFVTPLANPKPFDSEAALLLNVYFGRTRAQMIPITPPPAI